MTKGKFRLLAIDPTSKGFSFAVFEDTRLLDWRMRTVDGKNKNEGCIARIGELVKTYKPVIIITEDPKVKGSRRPQRVLHLVTELVRMQKRIDDFMVKLVPRRGVTAFFGQYQARNKHQIAMVIAQAYPELADLVPPPRKPWMAESNRTNIFDAVSFALYYIRAER